MLHKKLLRLIREVSPVDSQKIPVSPALQRLGQEFQAMYGEQLEARGEVRGEVKVLLKILGARKLHIDDAARARILACTDTVMLERWAEQAANATSIEQVFAD